ncbi:MAG: TonB-dependent receptor [Spongiibacteraceae bacterium]|nr:TonB-dependent receptor [Spongiibacteraceae bacterium]
MSTAPYTTSVTIGHYDAQGRYIDSDYAGSGETRIAIGPDGGNFADFNVLQFARYGAPGDGTRLPGSTWFGYKPLDPDDLELSADFAKQNQNVVSSHAGAAHIHYSPGDIEIASITAWQYHSKHMMMDADGSPANLFLFGTRARTTAFSQEIRVSGGDEGFYWTGGIYYLDLDMRATQGLLGAQGSLFGAAFGFPGIGVDVNRDPDLNTRSLSAFGQAEIGLADKWTLVAGGRVIRERQEYDLVMNFYANEDDYKVDRNVAVRPYNPPFSDKRSDTLWAGKLQLEYRPTAGLLTYAGINRGVKGGSYNAPGIGALSQAQIPFDAETLVSYEAGMKLTGNTYALNLEAFYYDYQDYQAFLFSSASGIVQNVDSEARGFAADLRVNLTSALSVSIGGAYTHAEIPDFEVAPGVFRTVRPAYSPRQQLNASVNYEVPADIAGGRLSLNAHANYASGFYHNLRNFDGHWFDSRTLFNFSASWQQVDSGLRLTTYLNNAFDERYGLIGFDNTLFCGCSLESYGPPRTYGVMVGYEF